MSSCQLTADNNYTCPVCGYRWTLNGPPPSRLCRPLPVVVPSESKPEPAKPSRPARIRLSQQEVEQAAQSLGITLSHLRNYRRAIVRWVRAGRPTRGDDECATIFNSLCLPCEMVIYDTVLGYRCRRCGCCVGTGGMAITNKVKMATEHCPLHKW